MRAIFNHWVRKLIGKLGVPYNRRLRVRGSPHPHGYDADLPLAAAESNAFRIHSVFVSFACRIAPLSSLASIGLKPRLTNAFSKKFENFEAAVALNFAYYNFVKTHGAIRMTPAQAAGIESSAWTVEELVKNCGE
jgi:hypothetical protein